MAKTDLTNQRQMFVEEYVRSGDHLEAAKKAGYKDTHTLRNQACKLRRECADEITEEFLYPRMRYSLSVCKMICI